MCVKYTFFSLYIYIYHKFYYFNHFRVYSLLALITVTLLWNYHHHTSPEICIFQNWNSIAIKQLLGLSALPSSTLATIILLSVSKDLTTLDTSGHCHCVQSCLTLCDPMDCSPSGFSFHGIFQARILEWVAIFSSRGSSRSRDWTWINLFYLLFFICLLYLLHWQTDSLPLARNLKQMELFSICPLANALFHLV